MMSSNQMLCASCGQNAVVPNCPLWSSITCEKMHTCCLPCYSAAGGQCPCCPTDNETSSKDKLEDPEEPEPKWSTMDNQAKGDGN